MQQVSCSRAQDLSRDAGGEQHVERGPNTHPPSSSPVAPVPAMHRQQAGQHLLEVLGPARGRPVRQRSTWQRGTLTPEVVQMDEVAGQRSGDGSGRPRCTPIESDDNHCRHNTLRGRPYAHALPILIPCSIRQREEHHRHAQPTWSFLKQCIRWICCTATKKCRNQQQRPHNRQTGAGWLTWREHRGAHHWRRLASGQLRCRCGLLLVQPLHPLLAVVAALL